MKFDDEKPLKHTQYQIKLNVLESVTNKTLKIMKIENCTMLIPMGNSYCRCKSSARGPRFKVSSEGLSTEKNILIRSPIKVLTEADLKQVVEGPQLV